MTPTDVIQLLEDPINLLRSCHLTIGGGGAAHPPANGQAAIRRFQVTMTGFTPIWNATGQDRVGVRIVIMAGIPHGPVAADEFDAYYIPMVQTSDVEMDASHYTLPTGHGSLKIMITSRLSGCTFGTGSDANGAVLVSHVQPKNTIADPNTKRNHLHAMITGGFRSAGDFLEKGNNANNYTDSAIVLGNRKGSHWSFYAQTQGVAVINNYPTNTITSVERFARV